MPRITPQQFFKSAGYNLWLVNDKKQPIKTTPTGIRVAIKEWSMITDFEPFYPSITAMDNIGFLSGLQYKSGRYVIILDFDIYSGKMQGVVPETQALFDEFRAIDTNGERGFFSGSTCHNYGVILDITDISTIIDKINQIIATTNNRNKIEYQGLEILYKNNVVLPPSKTHCKKCQTTHQKREMLAKVMAVCIPNPNQVAFVLNIMDKFLADFMFPITTRNTDIITSNNTNNTIRTSLASQSGITLIMTNASPRLHGYDLEVRRIHTHKMLDLLDIYKQERFTCGYTEWIKFLYQVCNANNSDEVITKFWQRGATGHYSNVPEREVAKYFKSCNILTEFNTQHLWNLGREDNPVKYKRLFESYDEPQFIFKPITFLNSTTKQPSRFINYQQIITYYATIPTTNTKYRVIKSGLGTGKTSMIREHLNQRFAINPNTRVIFITCRQTLADNISGSFSHMGFFNYLDSSIEINSSIPCIILSLDSLLKVALIDYDKDEYIFTPYDIVICDEICSLLKHFSFDQMANKTDIYGLFESIIKQSKETWFLDGDISNREISWLQRYLNYDITNNPPICNALPSIKYKFNITYCGAQQYSNFLTDLKNGLRLCIVCMSATEAKTIENLISQKFKTLCIISDSSDVIKKQCKQINRVVINYQCFIFSPCITVGVDINIPHFDKVYAYVCQQSVCPRDFYQMLARVRNPSNNTINILIANFSIKKEGLYNVMPFEKYKRIISRNSTEQNGLDYICYWNRWEQKHSDELWLDIFLWYADLKGHTVAFLDSNKSHFQESKNTLAQLITELELSTNIQADTAQDIFNAIVLLKEPRKETMPFYIEPGHEDYVKRNEIIAKGRLIDEDIAILNAIDNKNNLDHIESIKARIQDYNASTVDKHNYIKSRYWFFFGLPADLVFEDFENTYYGKIPIVVNYLNYIKFYDGLLNTINLAPFELSLFVRRAEYFKKTMEHLEISDITIKNKIKYSLVNDKLANLTATLDNEDFKTLFNIKVIKTGTKKIIDNSKTEIALIRNNQGKKFIVSMITKVIEYFGFEIVSKFGRIDETPTRYYELDIIKAIKQYTDTYGIRTEYEF